MKKKIIFLLILVLILIISFFIYLYHDQKVAILGYHSFATEKYIKDNNITSYFVMSNENFEDQLKYLKKHNYKTLTLDEFYCFKKGTCKIPRKSVLITMDDGYASNYYYAAPLLKKYNANATIFYVGVNYNNNFIWKDDPYQFMNKDVVLKLNKEYPNIEIASHTFDLHSEESFNKDKIVVNEDFIKEQDIVSSKYFAYPFGVITENIKNELVQNKYSLAFTYGPNKEHRKADRDDLDLEIPRLHMDSGMSLLKFKLILLRPYVIGYK
ncbi:MAG: polysaccharide deacetylase family protein [Bacilli bacterium]